MDEQINLGVNVESGDVKKLSTEFEKVTSSVQDLLTHIDKLEKKLSKLPTNKTININSPTNKIKGAGKTFFSSMDSSSAEYKQAFEDYHKYQQTQIDKEKELLKIKKESLKLEKERAEIRRLETDAATKNANARKLNSEKKLDENSADALEWKRARTKALNESTNWRAYREKHPEYFVTGGQNASWRAQTSKYFEKVGDKAASMGTAGRVIGDVMNIAGAALKAPAAGWATALTKATDAVLDFSKAAVQAYSEIQSIKTQLGVVFSNETQADAMFGEISQYAVKSPFGVQQTSELAVLLKQSGVYASDLMSTLRMIGDTAGGNMEKMKRIANNYAQIVSIGKASMLDMRQFAYAGIPIFEAVSKELGVSQQELRKLISEGKVTSDIVEKVFKDLTGINGIFQNATEKGAKTLKARLQNLSDAKQLAMSSWGDSIVNMGATYGNDGIVIKFVDTAERFFAWMQEHANISNIERDVRTIASSNSRIKALEELLEYAKKEGDVDLQKIVEAELEIQKNVFDVDKQRSIYSQSYDVKAGAYTRYQQQFGSLTEKEINEKIKEYERGLSTAEFQIRRNFDEQLYSNERVLTPEEEQAYLAQIDVYEQLINDLKKYKESIESINKLTEEEIRANRERNLLNAQQLGFDNATKIANQEGSYTSRFEKLYSIYTSSDEYKKKQEEEEQKALKEAQDLLKELSKFVDEVGNLDITKLSFGAYNEYLNTTGAIDPSRKLTIVEGKSDLQMTQDRELLTKQWNDISAKIENQLAGKGKYSELGEFQRGDKAWQLQGDNKSFFQNFDKILEKQLTVLQQLEKNSKDKTDKKFYMELYNSLLGSTYEYTVNTKGAEAKVETPKAVAQEFIPLWKRILASSTGLSTQGMTGTVQTMENYRDDMAIRNMASGVLTATMKSMGMDSAMNLMRTRGNALQLKGDGGYTYQVDWKETKKAIHDFATQLSASTEVISAYKKGLEEELSVYEELVAAGFTQGESQDLNQQKFVSSKTFTKLANSNSQLVNAFGEVLETAEGLIVTYDKATGKFKDSKGEEVQVDQLKMTGKLFDFIKEEIPRLRSEIHEANVTMLNNQVLQKMEKSAMSQSVINAYSMQHGYDENLKFLLENDEYSKGVISSYIKTIKEKDNPTIEIKGWNGEKRDKDVASVKNLSEEDIIANAFTYNTEEYKKLLQSLENEYESFIEEQGKAKWKYSVEGDSERIDYDKYNNQIKQMEEGLVEYDVEEYQRLLKLRENEYESIIQKYGEEAWAIANEGDSERAEYDRYNNQIKKITDSYLLWQSAIEEVYGSSEKLLSLDMYKALDDANKSAQRDKVVANALLDLSNFQEYGTTNPNAKYFGPENYGGWRGNKARYLKYGFGVSRDYDMEDLYIQAALSKNIEGLNENQFGINSSVYYKKDAAGNVTDELEDFYKGEEGRQLILETLTEAEKAMINLGVAAKDTNEIMEQMGGTILKAFSDLGKGVLDAPLRKMGENLAIGKDAAEDMDSVFRDLSASLLQASGEAMVKAGWDLVSRGALNNNMAMIAGGLALAGAGAFIGGIGSGMNQDKDKNNDETQKLEKLKDDLLALLRQAREDSIYYENTLRHKRAISSNDSFNVKNVHDAIITPQGDVVNTDPRDYLIATKTPKTLIGGGAPTINFSVIDKSTGIVVTQQKSSYDSESNSIDFEAIIESKVQEVIASDKGDEAFAAREMRINGRQVIA